MTSVFAGIAAWGFAIWEHIAGHAPIPEFWVWGLIVLLFGLGAGVAWNNKYKECEKKDAEINALKAPKPEIKCTIRKVFIDAVNFTLHSGDGVCLASDSYVTVEMNLENSTQIATTIQDIQLAVTVTYPGAKETYLGKFRTTQPGVRFYIEREIVPMQPEYWYESPLDEIVTIEKPLVYAQPKTCWARFYVKGLQLDEYKKAKVSIRLKDGVGEWSEVSAALDLECGKMKQQPIVLPAPRLR